MKSPAKFGIDTGRGKAYVGICTVFAALAFGSTLLRVLAVRIRKRGFHLYDYLIFAATVVSIGYYVQIIYGTLRTVVNAFILD